MILNILYHNKQIFIKYLKINLYYLLKGFVKIYINMH